MAPDEPPAGPERPLLGMLMAAILLITGANVASRLLTDISLAFTEEYSVAMLVALALAGTAAAVRAGGEIRLGLLADAAPPRLRRWLAALALLASIALFALLLWQGALLVVDEYRFEVTTPGQGHPQWLFTAVLPLLAALVLWRLLQALWRLLGGRGA